MAVAELLGPRRFSIRRAVVFALIRDALASLTPLLWMLFALKAPKDVAIDNKAPALPAKMALPAAMGVMTAMIYGATLSNHILRYLLQYTANCRSGGYRAVARSIGTNVDLVTWAFLVLVLFFHPIFCWFALRDSEQKIVRMSTFCFLVLLPYIALWGIVIFGFTSFLILLFVFKGSRKGPRSEGNDPEGTSSSWPQKAFETVAQDSACSSTNGAVAPPLSLSTHT